MKQRPLTRRQFINRTVAAAAGVSYFPSTLAIVGKSANDKLGIGVIGCGSRGRNHLQGLHWLKNDGDQNIDIVAVCDTYRPRLKMQAEAYNAKAYSDHRDLLADKAVDVVFIATPDHHHVMQTLDAISAGKHVYSEKPMSHWRQFDLTKKLRQEVKKTNCVYEVGTQRMASSAWLQARRLIEDGLIGQLVYGECEYFRMGDWAEFGMPIDDPNAREGPDLNWDTFLGDSPKRPFDVSRYFRWRMYEDYAGGPLTDLYCHFMAQTILLLGVTLPKTVAATGGIYRYINRREVPDTFSMIIEYPEKITFIMKGSQATGFNVKDSMPIIRGTEGVITFNSYKEIVLSPLEEGRESQVFPIERAFDDVMYWKRFLDCCREGNTKTDCDVDLAYYTQVPCQMAYASYKQGKTAKYDAKKEEIII